MKNILLAAVFSLYGASVFSQTAPAPYHLPDNFKFDYEVTQEYSGKKKGSDSSEMHFFFTKSGEYAGLKANKGNDDNFIVYAKDGTMIIFNQKEKSIIIMRLKKMLGDLAGAANDKKKNDQKPNETTDKDNRKKYTSVKTGRTKTICGYPAEEYLVTDDQGKKGNVWFAKVDFNPQSLFSGLGGNGGMRGGMMKDKFGDNPFTQAIAEPNTLLAEVTSQEEGRQIYTKSINKSTTSVPTKGYAVQDFSSMGLKEMIEAQMKKKKGAD